MQVSHQNINTKPKTMGQLTLASPCLSAWFPNCAVSHPREPAVNSQGFPETFSFPRKTQKYSQQVSDGVQITNSR